MHFLDPIYNNNTGVAFALKSNLYSDEPYLKIQLQLGDIAILMNFNEMESFLKTIRYLKTKCKCSNCNEGCSYKVIKCETAYTEIKIKATPTILNGLEELIQGVLFESQLNNLLEDNNIL